MRKTFLGALLFALLAPAMPLRAADCSTTAGGVPVLIPTPQKELSEVGNDKRGFFEYMVPSRNRLLCAFVPADFLPRLKNPASGMEQYAVVEVSRRLDEKPEVTSADFEELVSAFKQQLGDSTKLNQTVQTTSAEINSKLKAIHNSKDVSIDKPIPLGVLFQISDAYAFAMIVPVSSGGVTVRKIGASILIRVRDRLIFAYVYSGADDEKSLKWVEKTAEQWTQEILTSNSIQRNRPSGM